MCLVSVRRLALRSPGCHAEAPAGIKNGPLPFHLGGSVTGSGPCCPSSSRTPLENQFCLVCRPSSTQHLNSLPSHGLSSTFQPASQSPCRLSASSPGPALSPVRSALLRCALVLKTQAPVGHGGVSATAPSKPFLGAAWPLTDPEPSQQVPRPVFCVAAETLSWDGLWLWD